MEESEPPCCSICHTGSDAAELIPADLVREPINTLIRKDFPAWGAGQWICKLDLDRYRSLYIHTLFTVDSGAVMNLEAEVLESLKRQNLLSKNPNEVYGKQLTFGQRMADGLARFGGSWNFILGFGFILLVWISINTLVLSTKAFDPYPFILLNLVLSSLAALQAPIIMMSQNRLEKRDRLRAEEDYRINLKAELEIRLLHEKLDHLLLHQWQHLLEIQELQLDIMQTPRP